MEVFSAFGGAPFRKESKKAIRLILKGCVNRPFFHISVQELNKTPEDPVIEQIGNYDPLPNKYNEKLVALNFQKLEYWLRKGAEPTEPVQKLLGLCGYFPVHPRSFQEAYLKRKEIKTELEKLRIEAAKFTSVKSEETDKPANELFNSSNTNTVVEDESTDIATDKSTDIATDKSQTGNVPDDGAHKD